MKNVILGLLLISLSACSSWFERKPDRPAAPPVPQASATVEEVPHPQDGPAMEEPLTDNIASPTAETIQPETVDVTQNRPSYIDQKYSEDESNLPVKSDKEKPLGIDPEKSLGWLKNGNKRFLKGALRADGQSKKDIKKLSAGEKPHAVIFSNSDSRFPPEIIFDEKLGEIYVIRNLNLNVDSSVIKSLNYALNDLGVRLVIVLDGAKNEDFSFADDVTQKLVNNSKSLKMGLESGTVTVVPAIYDLESGKVSFGK